MKICNLPDAVRQLVEAQKRLRAAYPAAKLRFTLDGKLVGDLGEAIAAEFFGVRLEQGKHIDGWSLCGKPVQIKTTGRPDGGVNFRNSDFADAVKVHLIVIYIDWESCSAEVLYNGPEIGIRPIVKRGGIWQREVSRQKLLRFDKRVLDHLRLKPLAPIGREEALDYGI